MSELFQLGPTTSFTEPQRRELNALFLRLTQAISGGINVTTNIAASGGGVGPGTVGTVPVFGTPTTVIDSTAAVGDILLGTPDQPVSSAGAITVKAGDAPGGAGIGGTITLQPGTGGDSEGRIFLNYAGGGSSGVMVGGGNVTIGGGLLGAAFLQCDATLISTDGAGSLSAQHLHAADGFNGTVSPVTSITVVDGVVTAAS